MKIEISGAVLRWAVHPSDTESIKYLDGVNRESQVVPHENDVITRPFLVDPTTCQPIPVRVIQIQNKLDSTPQVVVVIVARADVVQ
ncbi:hypothetical protein ACO0K2_04240 [Undibacterium sp. MH2W]|uniref:hypothetical protein n=1 Tax=Undibacterium sp. MH2W TaxID=3413044 RepID=UPI003BF19842